MTTRVTLCFHSFQLAQYCRLSEDELSLNVSLHCLTWVNDLHAWRDSTRRVADASPSKRQFKVGPGVTRGRRLRRI